MTPPPREFTPEEEREARRLFAVVLTVVIGGFAVGMGLLLYILATDL